jgi:carbon-monoxide dehydrogenase small subunit
MRVVKTISLAINGRDIKAEVEPRLHLADFLRENQFLTATHIGCEHGVCGACTVLIDGAPARSCITFAVAADRAAVTTLEGFENDPVMNVLREAFSEHHALQCGFCTPGMLMTARDIIARVPEADENRIRQELSGNLCRCTGYVGIVEAVQSALKTVNASAPAAPPTRRSIGPVGSHPPTTPTDFSRRSALVEPKQHAPSAVVENFDAVEWTSIERNGMELRQSFSVRFPRAEVWRFFADLDQVTRCMPGARLTKPVQGSRAEGEINVKLGPIVSSFHGILEVERDDEHFRGTVRGAGRDARSPSSARAIIAYDVRALNVASAEVDVSVKFLLSGALAQFSRSGLFKDVADHLTHIFAQNLEARLSGDPVVSGPTETLDAGAVARSAVWARVRRFAGRILGR